MPVNNKKTSNNNNKKTTPKEKSNIKKITKTKNTDKSVPTAYAFDKFIHSEIENGKVGFLRKSKSFNKINQNVVLVVIDAYAKNIVKHLIDDKMKSFFDLKKKEYKKNHKEELENSQMSQKEINEIITKEVKKNVSSEEIREYLSSSKKQINSQFANEAIETDPELHALLIKSNKIVGEKSLESLEKEIGEENLKKVDQFKNVLFERSKRIHLKNLNENKNMINSGNNHGTELSVSN